jgi:hypothetical protein
MGGPFHEYRNKPKFLYQSNKSPEAPDFYYQILINKSEAVDLTGTSSNQFLFCQTSRTFLFTNTEKDASNSQFGKHPFLGRQLSIRCKEGLVVGTLWAHSTRDIGWFNNPTEPLKSVEFVAIRKGYNKTNSAIYNWEEWGDQI